MTNIAKGRDSFDVVTGNTLVQFFNRNSTEYPTEVGGQKFELVPVTKQKDIMLNVARMQAQQEYDRIMELVSVLQNQADQIKHRLQLTDMVHAAKYDFKLYHGQIYWLVSDTHKQITRLVKTGPTEWGTGAPDEYRYITRITWLGDHTWTEVQ